MTGHVVVWDGTPRYGRQLFVPEYPHQAPPPLPSVPVKPTLTNAARVLLEIEAEPRTARELIAKLTRLSASQVYTAINSLREQGRIVVIGERSSVTGRRRRCFGRVIPAEAVYGVRDQQ